jgi:hypothetical protein
VLSKIFEWSRVAHASPDDDFVTKRSAVVGSLAEELPKKLGLLLDCACAAAGGVTPRFGQGSDLVTTVVEAVRGQQPAFPQDLSENDLELRVVCALVVGELAERAVKSKPAPSMASQLMSAIVCAGLLNRPLAGPKYLQAMLRELVEVCATACKRGAELRRNRYSLAPYVEGVNEAADVPAFWKDAKPKFINLARAADANAAMDREEIDTLWWAFNGVSRTTGKGFAEMTVGQAALCAGLELANLVMPPPLPNTKLLTRRVIMAGRAPKSLEEQPLRDMTAQWDSAVAAATVSENPKTAEFTQQNPAIFSLTWICHRICDGSMPSAAETKKATLWDMAFKAHPELLARQAFDERIAQRLHEISFPG